LRTGNICPSDISEKSLLISIAHSTNDISVCEGNRRIAELPKDLKQWQAHMVTMRIMKRYQSQRSELDSEMIQQQKGNKALIPSLPCSHDHWYD
jgi:hypothetical protein